MCCPARCRCNTIRKHALELGGCCPVRCPCNTIRRHALKLGGCCPAHCPCNTIRRHALELGGYCPVRCPFYTIRWHDLELGGCCPATLYIYMHYTLRRQALELGVRLYYRLMKSDISLLLPSPKLIKLSLLFCFKV